MLRLMKLCYQFVVFWLPSDGWSSVRASRRLARK